MDVIGFRRKSDEQLIKQALEGSEDAWLTLVKRYETRLYNHALRMVGNSDDAMDLLQDVFLSVFRNLANFRGDAPFGAWIFRIATFRCTDHLRRKTKTQFSEYEELPDADRSTNPATGYEDVRSNGDIVRMLGSLPNEQRQVLELKFFQNFTFDEIAVQLGISSNTAKSRLYAALKKLRGTDEASAIAC
ncbi:MAG: RNA polymerase sigma factor [Pseudomonadales bacterium]|nr:RNA polymerase sigma factor [Pseudomonadales bacterium]MBO6658212.1 RNA polymerase sigma factor [Pseudomonadales bacterium]